MTTRNLDLPEFDPVKHWETWTDMLDREYSAGDFVAYAVTVGKSASMSIGMVRRINKLDSKGEPLERNTGTWRDPNPVPTATITICPLVDSVNRYGRWSDRDSTVGPDKIVRLDNVSVIDLLDSECL